MTKPVTGVAMMTLYERRHFQLDDPVERSPDRPSPSSGSAEPPSGSRVHISSTPICSGLAPCASGRVPI
ncbi:MAG: beta-lactamase family protein [Ilumatobacteraceae bacterium]|nr:beta-lactamase family protein [Ilumatobacteraceae bacterium]